MRNVIAKLIAFVAILFLFSGEFMIFLGLFFLVGIVADQEDIPKKKRKKYTVGFRYR